MGDISAEPSMEDILSSIKRIIAEEGDAAGATRMGRKLPRPASMPRADIDDFGHDEILELSNPVRYDQEDPMPQPYAYSPAPTPPAQAAPAPATAAVPEAEPILSPQATQATRGPLEALSRMIVKPDVSGSDTLEGLVREMIRPMLRDWMDANLPNMVEQMVAQEIARITSQR
ncbi:DUF2497 domain-containing protein [Sphingomonas sp. PB4P5]|uniref:DUF2497 domain-containing protein n=1 Tax=Parasphingomonas puruogangriensis TaxID=3096155 RepID=UPI002FC64289